MHYDSAPSSLALRQAVRDLRTALGKTQTDFGALIGKGLATIQRYENLVPPKGKVLVVLASLAEQNSQPMLAALFQSALNQELGGLRASLGIGHIQEAVLYALEDVRQVLRQLPTGNQGIRRHLEHAQTMLESALATGDEVRSKVAPAEPEEDE